MRSAADALGSSMTSYSTPSAFCARRHELDLQPAHDLLAVARDLLFHALVDGLVEARRPYPVQTPSRNRSDLQGGLNPAEAHDSQRTTTNRPAALTVRM
jgi:hypothetical protein